MWYTEKGLAWQWESHHLPLTLTLNINKCFLSFPRTMAKSSENLNPNYIKRFKRGGTITSFIGFFLGSCFTLIYFVAPFYVFTAVALPVFVQKLGWSLIAKVWAPIVLSVVLPTLHAPNFVQYVLPPMLTFFNYDEIHETSDDEMLQYFGEGKSCILVAQPHGVLSLTGICSATYCIPEFRKIKTAAASALINFPILKQVMGIFGLFSASKKSLLKHLKKGGAAGTVVIYVGGIAELFKCSETEERLFLKHRKGFVKLALQTGTPLIPLYMFGNTTVLTPCRWKVLENISRTLQASITYVWGTAGLPIPRKKTLCYVRGKMIVIPKIEEPTQADIDKWHAAYIAEVTRIYEKYSRVVCDGDYANKTLLIE